MQRTELQVGQRVRLHPEAIQKYGGMEEADNPTDPVGTVMKIHAENEFGVFGFFQVFPVEVSWDGVDYTQKVYNHKRDHWFDSHTFEELIPEES